MEAPQQYRLKFIGDEIFINALRQYAAQEPLNLKIESEKGDEDATRLGFDLATVSAVVTLISGSLYLGGLAAKLPQWVKSSRANKAVIQTPFETIELHKHEGITEEEVRKLLKLGMDMR